MYWYIYESHLGGYYATDDVLDYEDTYCDTCGDSDQLVFSGTEEDIKKEYQEKMKHYNTLKDKYIEEGDIEKIEDVEYDLDIIKYEYEGMLEAIRERS